MPKTSININDAIFFWDMIGSEYSPNYKPNLYGRPPYAKILKDVESHERKRFLSIYNDLKYLLTEKEISILDQLYGVCDEKCSSLKELGEWLGVGPGRVRQIRNKAGYKLSREVKRTLHKANDLK
ncbi:hypothetical protein [Anaerobacillus alkaliphilus]|uniref:hypothetical protein n=1 Tax=Anaerobacillus alkaliphilus TaxID=1548597 RepID=UPI00100B388B|nr:hypothetical protein [Anaerobacillus alkaliphilus]